jgi:hypothetical protein
MKHLNTMLLVLFGFVLIPSSIHEYYENQRWNEESERSIQQFKHAMDLWVDSITFNWSVFAVAGQEAPGAIDAKLFDPVHVKIGDIKNTIGLLLQSPASSGEHESFRKMLGIMDRIQEIIVNSGERGKLVPEVKAKISKKFAEMDGIISDVEKGKPSDYVSTNLKKLSTQEKAVKSSLAL